MNTNSIQCPVCETPLADAKATRCPQCDSDLTVFRLLEQKMVFESVPPPMVGEMAAPVSVASSLASHDAVAKKSASGLVFKWVMAIIGILSAAVLLGAIIHVQISLLGELRQERSSREALESRSAQMTERLTEKIIAQTADSVKTAGSYQAGLNSLMEMNREQQAEIKKLNEQVEKLVKKKRPVRRQNDH